MTLEKLTSAAAVLLGAFLVCWVSAAARVAAWDDPPSAHNSRSAGPVRRAQAPNPERGSLTAEAPGNVGPFGRAISPGIKLPEHARARLGTTRLRHALTVQSVAFAPDGRTLASAGWDGVRFWERATGEPAANLPIIQGDGRSNVATFSPDGRKLAVGYDTFVQIWDLDARRELSRTGVLPGPVWGIAFAPDGRTLASTGEADPNVRIWEVATGRQVRSLRSDVEALSPRPLAFSPDGKRLAIGGRSRAPAGGSQTPDGEVITIWGLDDDRDPLIIRQAHEWWLFSLAFTPDGTLISGGSTFKTVRGARRKDQPSEGLAQVRSWDADSGRMLKEWDLLSAPGISKVALSRDGRTLVSSHRDRHLIWELPAGRLVRTIPAGSAADSPSDRGIAVSPEGRTLASLQRDHAVHLWDVGTGKPLLGQGGAHDTLVSCVVASPDGRLVATGDDDGTVRLWDSARGEVLHHFRFGDRVRVRAVRFAPDGRALAAASEDPARRPGLGRGVLRIWDLPDLRPRREIRFPRQPSLIEYSPDGRRLAVAFEHSRRRVDPRQVGPPPTEDVVGLFDAETGREEIGLPGHDKPVLALTFARDGKTLATAGQDNTFRIWDLEAGRMIREIPVEGHRYTVPPRGQRIATAIESAAFSADLRTAVSSRSLDDRLLVWDLGAGRTRRSRRDDPSLVWDLRAGWSRRTIQAEAHARDVLSISPDGRLLARAMVPVRGKPDAPIRIWDLKTKREVLRLEPGAGAPVALAFSADGKTLVSGMTDTTALVWDLSSAYEAVNRGRD